MNKKMPPIHPGEILLEEFLKPMKITQYKLAKDIKVSQIRISEIVRGLRTITPDTAIRLGKYFKLSKGFWLNLQSQYDLEVACDKLENEKIESLKEKDLKTANSIATTLREKLQF